eukprot:scaffold6016_cov119-Isochrysis_galbana.AAC.12
MSDQMAKRLETAHLSHVGKNLRIHTPEEVTTANKSKKTLNAIGSPLGPRGKLVDPPKNRNSTKRLSIVRSKGSRGKRGHRKAPHVYLEALTNHDLAVVVHAGLEPSPRAMRPE